MSEKYFSLFNTKGTQKGVLSLENPGYYENGCIEIKLDKKQKGQNPFINRVQKANAEFAELTIDELEILGEVESHRDMTVFDVNKAHVELRMPLNLIVEMQKRGKFVIDNEGYYYYSPDKSKEFITIPHFVNKKNNICTIKKSEGKTLFFIDTTLTLTDEGMFVKDKYVTQHLFEAYFQVLTEGAFIAEGARYGVTCTLKELLNFFLYGFSIKGFYSPKNTYCQQIGNRGGESFTIRADVLNTPAQVVNVKDTDIEKIVKTESIKHLVEKIAENPCIAVTSMSQGFNALLFSTPEEARLWENQFIDGKYDISATIGISAKVDKHFVTRNLVFLTVANEKDNNCYGNALYGGVSSTVEDICGKFYVVHSSRVFKGANAYLRIKNPVTKAESNIIVTDKTGNKVPNWIIAPISECDPAGENPFLVENKMGNIQQLLHLGYVPEEVVVEIEGVIYNTYMFKGIKFYVDSMTSSDKNIEKDFEFKPYSTMISSIMNDILLTHKGDKEVIEFEERLNKLVDVNKINKICNLAGLTTVKANIIRYKK